MLQILTIGLPYDAIMKIKGEREGVSDATYEALREKMPEMKLPPLEERKSGWVADFVGTVDDARTLTEFGIEPEVKRVRGMWSESLPKLDALGAATSTPPSIVNITVAGSALFNVQTVRVEENCCTDVLQSLLDGGWRIVAVCPPNDCRRPTYVLGHQNAKA